MTLPDAIPLPSTAEVRARDGTRLVERTWRPASGVPRRGSLLLVHGVGEHALRYAHVAGALLSLGVVVRAYDQRGFGASGGARGMLPHADALLDDLRDRWTSLAREMAGEGDAAPPFLLGHSMGGCVVARAVTGGWVDAPRGMMLSSPGLVPRIGPVRRAAARLGSRLVPDLRVPHGLPLDRLSHDPAVLPMVKDDPLCHTLVTPRLVQFMIDAGERAIADAPRCRVPALLLVAGDDHLVRPEGARRFHAALPPQVGTMHEYAALYHEVLQERAEDRERVVGDLLSWVEARLPA